MDDSKQYMLLAGAAYMGFVMALSGSEWWLMLSLVFAGFIIFKDRADDERDHEADIVREERSVPRRGLLQPGRAGTVHPDDRQSRAEPGEGK